MTPVSYRIRDKEKKIQNKGV